jgi:hypothetical protein
MEPKKKPQPKKESPKKKPQPKKEPPKKKPQPKKEPPKKERSKQNWPIITIQKQQDTTKTDHLYDKRLNTIVKRIREENTFTDDKLRFGWNTGDN